MNFFTYVEELSLLVLWIERRWLSRCFFQVFLNAL